MTDELNPNDDDFQYNSQEKAPPILLFFTPIALKSIQKKSNETVQHRYTSLGQKYNMCFKMIKSDSKLVKIILFSYGFLHCSSRNSNCNLIWSNTHLSANVLRSIKPWQRINHFPRSYMITKKDTLYEGIYRAIVQYGNWFEFIPDFFCTPLSNEKREKLIDLCRDIEYDRAPPFIVKPASSSRGRDIYFLRSADDVNKLDNNAKCLISRYIDRPFLINRLKCDLRVYVLVTSFYPLIVYVYSDGLARFAVHEYDELNRRNYTDVNTHLTNYSLNKTSANFIRNDDFFSDNIGHKWTLGALLRKMESQNVDTSLLMIRIEDLIIKTLLSVQGSVAASCRKFNLHPKCCFELFGFDIIVDENLKPWLLEVNLSPSLACDAPLDSILKTNLLCDILNIACIPLVRDKNAFNQCTQNNQFNNESIQNGDIKHHATSSSLFCDANINISSKQDDNKFDANAESANNIEYPKTNVPKRIFVNAGKSKPIFSANTTHYSNLAKCHFEKLEIESLRQGRFIRVFPRTYTWDLYSSVLEDVGEEQWDNKLHKRLLNANKQSNNKKEVFRRDVEEAHKQLMDAKNYPTAANLSSTVRNVLLHEALNEAVKYRRRMYSIDAKPYPTALPSIRSQARRRTHSQVIADETRRAFLFAKRNQLANDCGMEKERENNFFKPAVMAYNSNELENICDSTIKDMSANFTVKIVNNENDTENVNDAEQKYRLNLVHINDKTANYTNEIESTFPGSYENIIMDLTDSVKI